MKMIIYFKNKVNIYIKLRAKQENCLAFFRVNEGEIVHKKVRYYIKNIIIFSENAKILL